ncbi:hypothetical protein Natoc_4373 (plasmid) [Natronococcus occultus SP4]|uniref:Uncharacterized protein n=1 Tax=Natronococcus occultus SP4 TaxID=694430 RepID=L0K6Q8_9EURY|nr:hypothetical protein Natoc_4373 [Natronococcus occultus SP4]
MSDRSEALRISHSNSEVSTNDHKKTPTRESVRVGARTRIGVKPHPSMYEYTLDAVSCFDSRIVSDRPTHFGGVAA